MRVNKKVEAYIPENLEKFKNDLLIIRKNSDSKRLYKPCLDLTGLQEAIQKLPNDKREKIERFWGLTGGMNHSKRLRKDNSKDIAYIKLCNEAINAAEELQTLDFLRLYDENVSKQINSIVRKVNRSGLEISDSECVKYIIAFFVYLNNGPKMSFEDEMDIDTNLDETFLLDEIETLSEIYEEISQYPDNTINLKILVDFLEMMDFQDILAIKKSMRIEIPSDSLPKKMKLEDVDVARNVLSIRKLKEKAFPYGAWNVTTELIIGGEKSQKNLANFMKELDSIRKDWSKIADFWDGEKKLKTTSQTSTLNVYKIGGLEFTDVYEVMFLYLERNLITITKE